MITKTFSAPPVQIGNGKATFWITRRGLDLCGDDVDPDGVDLTIFRNNPVALWNHDTSHVIGRWSMPVKVEDGLQATITFAGTAHAQEKRQLVETGFIKAASVSFDPKDAIPLDPSRPRGGQLYKRWLLIEVSLVATPAQPKATLIDFQDKAYRSRNTQETHMADPGYEYRQTRAAEVMRRADRGPTPTQRATAPGLSWQDYKNAEDARMAQATELLFENSEEGRMKRAAEIAARAPKAYGYDAADIERHVIETKAKRQPLPEVPSWQKGF